MNSQWETCLHDYVRGLETRSSATATSYKGILTRCFSRYDPGTITRREVEDFMHSASTRGKPPAIATMNARVAAIGGLYRFATNYVPEGETEPLWTRALPTLGITRGKPERSPKGLTLEEMERLFSVIPQTTLLGIRDRAVLLLTFWTARRRSEIAELRYGDILVTRFTDAQGNRRIASVLAFRGKGHKSEVDHQEIPEPAMNALSWYLLASGRAEGITAEDPLFAAVGREAGHGGNVHRDETRPLTGSTLAKRIRAYAKEAGICASLHTLRHSAARARYESGEDIRSIQHLLRHQNLSTTDIYLRSLVGVEDVEYKRLLEKYGHL